MEILKLTKPSVEASKAVVKKAVAVLRAGGLVIYPTETVYGVGVDATNPTAVEKLLAYKSRREGKPLSIAVADRAMAEQYVALTDQAKQFYKRFLPGPYTIVSASLGQVAPGVESEFGTLGVRIPDHPLVLELVKELGKPVTATSANASGQKQPYTVSDILDNLSAKQTELIDLVIDAGTLPRNDPSTVVDTTLTTPLTIRGNFLESATAFTTHSAQETRDLAGKLLLKHWETAKTQGLLIGLDGELGAGKTVFAQGAAAFLKIDQPVTSPTYTYMNEYDYDRHSTRGKLHHLDLWKIDSQEAFDQLQVETLLQPRNIVLIEWWGHIHRFWTGKKPDLTAHLEETEEGRSIIVQEKNA